MSFIAWVPEASRAGSISRALGGESRTFYDLRIHRKALVPLRYLLSAIRTVSYLVRRRPRAVIVQTPPVPAAALVLAWARIARVPVVLDTHPASFGLDGRPAHRVMLPLLARLVPRAAGCIVTTPELGNEISRWRGNPLIVHEAPMVWSERVRPNGASGRRRALFICTFAPDEPLLELLEAARRLPHVTMQITGDLRRLPAKARRAAPENVEWLGYLIGEEYVAALTAADVLIALTQRRESVQRSAHEAVDALRPLVVSDWPHVPELFPYAVTVSNEPASIAAGIDDAFARWDELSAHARDAQALQHRRWSEQLSHLRAALAMA
jgi:Glycosyl transferase 4-like domain/Glycosyl transferases group 1